MYCRYTTDDVPTGEDYGDDPAVVAEHVALVEEVWAASVPSEQWRKEHG